MAHMTNDEHSKMYSVYKHICPCGKIYIGITSRNPKKRWSGGSGYRNNQHFTNAIKKYGWSNIEHHILEVGLTQYEAKELEKKLITEYKSQDKRYGYNITAGGEGLFGASHSEETKKKISERHKGRKMGEDQKRWISEHMKLKYQTDDDYRERFRSINVGRKASPETIKKYKLRNNKPVIQFDLNGNEIARFEKIKTAGAVTGVHTSSISANCKGKLITAGGFKWSYAEEGSYKK